MKKLTLVFILMALGGLAFAQSEIMSFLSLGFNARQITWGDNVYDDYYFFGFDGYSEAFIYGDRLELGLGSMTFYPNARIIYGFPPYEYRRYAGQDNSTGYERLVPTQGYSGEEHKVTANGRLVYWALTDERDPVNVAENIEQNAQGVTVSFSYNGTSYRYRYYNIPRAQLLDLYLEYYVKLVRDILELINENEYQFQRERLSEIILPVFQRRTAREMAIFRNGMYAIKGSRFTNASWTDFFNKYLPDYRARYTSAEVNNMFNENEQWLLDMVIQHEYRLIPPLSQKRKLIHIPSIVQCSPLLSSMLIRFPSQG